MNSVLLQMIDLATFCLRVCTHPDGGICWMLNGTRPPKILERVPENVQLVSVSLRYTRYNMVPGIIYTTRHDNTTDVWYNVIPGIICTYFILGSILYTSYKYMYTRVHVAQ